MKRVHAVFLKRIVTLIMMLSVGVNCVAFSVFSQSELVWKNISVMGKRMSVYCIFTDSKGIVWLGTNNGLFFYDDVTTHAVSETEIARNPIYSIIENDGVLLLGTNKGLMTYSLHKNVFEYCTINNSLREIRCMLLINNTLWIGSIYGMYTFNLDTKEIQDVSEGLPHKSIYSMLRDCRGILYVGTYDGLARWDSTDKKFEEVNIPVQMKTSNNLFVNCLLETADRQYIYVGTEEALFCYTPMTGMWERNTYMNGKSVKSLTQSNNGHLLVGTDNGIFDFYDDNVKQYVHDSRQEQTLSNNEIWCIRADDNNVWVGHEVGFSIASSSNVIRVVKLSALTQSGEGNDIHSIYRDRRGTLWFNGTNGIIKLVEDKPVKWYRPSGHPHSLSHNHIRAIKEDSDGGIWFATDGGLNRYNAAAGNFDVFHIVDKVGKHSSNWVYALEEDDDHFIIGSYLGGLHYVSKSKFVSSGGIIVSDNSINVGSPVFKNVNLSLNNDLIHNVLKDAFGNIWILCFNDDFLTEVMPDGHVEKYNIEEITGNSPTLISLDGYGRLWCAFKGGVVVFNKDNSHNIVRFPKTDGEESILAIGKVGDGMWISTVANIWNINGKTLEVNLLPIPQKSYKSIFADSVTGKVYLGGLDEIIEVDPHMMDNSTDRTDIKMVLTGVNDNFFDLSRLKPDKGGLTIPYGGTLTLVVSNLDYSPDALQRYMYKLAKSPTDTIGKWIIMPEDFNTISLSELKMGNYFVLLKTVDTLGTVYSLPLDVQVPWPLAWWAFCLYFFLIITIIVCVILYMRKRNVRLIQEEDRRKSLENVERKLTFLSNISHDLKTPLSMIMGPVSLLKEKIKDTEMKQSLEIVYENAVRLNNMIHRTLEIHHLEDGGENLLILSTFNAVDFCKSIFDTFKENHPQKKFVFHSTVSQLMIEADAVKFESIITNLISNACKYSENNSTISCSINCIDGNIYIVVSDDGIGIAEIDQPLVFQRMFRSPSTAKMREGTGIGLYLIKKYIELMKGKVELYSEKGKGTSFIVTLPLSEKTIVRHDADMNNIDYKKPKILIVEDNQQISEFICNLLKKDYICLLAENGRAGLSIASSCIPDLIISDEMMPVMKGLEMIQQLKQNIRLANIPIIMLTAKTDNDTENESVKLGVDIFMPKPFEPSVLLGRIKHLLQSRAKLQEAIRVEALTEVKPIEAESVSEKQLARIAKVIEDNISDPDLNVNFVCEKCGIPNKQLYRIVKKYMGVAPLDYIRSVRLQKAAMLLSQKRFTVSEICYMVGFKTPSYFAKCFQEQFGVKPSLYQSDDK